MPTIKILYTDNINIKDKLDNFTKATHTKLVEIIATDIYTCRTLVYPCSDYRVGLNSEYDAYIQLEIAILPGRSPALRKELGKTLLQDLRELCVNNSVSIDYRVIVSETDTEFYFGL
jgi:5-carboxymethyl-2-hydroxymuconate isomerase